MIFVAYHVVKGETLIFDAIGIESEKGLTLDAVEKIFQALKKEDLSGGKIEDYNIEVTHQKKEFFEKQNISCAHNEESLVALVKQVAKPFEKG